MINIPKGTRDVLPFESYKWHYIENTVKSVAKVFNLREVRTPTFEHTEVFLRGVGDTTDVVSKEMYTFLDKGKRSITLKPEGTAGVARSYIENALANLPQPIKMFYITPVFRYENPQAGRLREHHQFGIEVYGSQSAGIDAEVIAVADTIFKRLGVSNITLNINSIGCKACRADYNRALKEYLSEHIDDMCPTCKERLDKNPLRILDCKEEKCAEINKNAPIILDYICEECDNHFKELQSSLKQLGIDYKIDARIVRGLDYYTKTVFEFVSDNIGAKGTVCGGGRYDGLVESLGGKPTPGVGFGMGLERLLLLLDSAGIEIQNDELLDIYVISFSDEQREFVRGLTSKLRNAGISADSDNDSRSMKSQLKFANKIGAKYIIIIGDEEVKSGELSLKNMTTGEQKKLAFEDIINEIK